MRHPLVPALLVVVALVTYALLGAVVAGATPAAATTENATVSGEVVTADGAPADGAYVVLEPVPADRVAEATDGSRAVAESLLRYGMAEPDDVVAVRSGTEGTYRAEVPPGDYVVVAVSERDWRVSRLHEVTVEEGEEVDLDLVLDAERVQELEAETVDAEPGGTVEVPLELLNTDDEPVQQLDLELAALPDGWTVEDVETDGNYDEDAGTVTWETVASGERAAATVTVGVPEDADTGRVSLLRAVDADSHFVEWTLGPRVFVKPPDWTPPPTHTPSPATEPTDVDDATGEDAGNDEDTPTDGGPADDSTTAPGLGPLAAAVALLLATAAVRRTESR